MKTRLYIIRHGQSVGNKIRRILGHSDMPLTELGVLQAEKTAAELANVEVDAIYASDLMRTMETAEPNAKLRGMTVIPDRELRELFIGDWEAMYLDDIIAKYPELFEKEWKTEFGTFVSPGGESVAELAERIYAALVRIASSHPDKNVIVVSHGAAIRAFWAKITGIAPKEIGTTLPYASNASYTVIDYDIDGGVFIPVEYSHDSHLSDVMTTWKD